MADANFSTPHIHIVPRLIAKRLGMKRYFTGKPCKQGHISARIASNGTCVECSAISAQKWRSENIEQSRESQRQARQKNKEVYNERHNAARVRSDPDLPRRQAQTKHDRESRASAIAKGRQFYKSVRECIYGHVGERIAKDYNCATCWRLSLRPESDEVQAKRQESNARKREASERYGAVVKSRNQAAAEGKTTYMGRACKNGHGGLRWVSSYGCVACGRRAESVDAKREYDAKYRATIPAGLLTERSRAWVAKNRDKRRSIVKAYSARRRAIEAGGDPTHIVHSWEISAKKVCYWCGAKCAKNYHIDHYEPLAKGGAHAVDNLVIACPTCNLTKNAKDPYHFAAQVGRLF